MGLHCLVEPVHPKLRKIMLPLLFRQIEDITLTQLRIQLNTSYGRKGEEAVTEAWDYMQTIVSFYILMPFINQFTMQSKCLIICN